jgi:uncharacterized protein (DUF488 family)
VTTELLTVGHGRASEDELPALLKGAAVELVVDIRRFPGSRTSPHLARDALTERLPRDGVAYRWDERLGGRRSLPRDVPSPDTWWTVPAFRAYAAHTRTPEFRSAMAQLLADAEQQRVAVMCSETVWWRCHRRLVADVAVLVHGVEARHLMPDGTLRPHRPAEGARLTDDGKLVWDGA